MAAFSRIKAAIVALVEAYYAGNPSNDIRKRQRAALGDAGTSAPFNVVEVDGLTMLAGSMFGFPLDPEDPEGSGPDPEWLDRTAIATLLTGLGPFLHYVEVHSSTSPGTGADNTVGFDQGSRWIRTDTARTWTCHSAATGAAVWVEDTGGGGGGGGDSVTVNGAALVDLNFSDTTPAAGAGDLNILWTKDGGSPANVAGAVDVSALEPLLHHNLVSSGSLAWGSCAHTGTASRIAGFDALGATTYYAIGTNLQAWDADLDAYAALSTTGLVTRTGAGSVVTRQIGVSGTGMSVTDPTGVGGDPTVVFAPPAAWLAGLIVTPQTIFGSLTVSYMAACAQNVTANFTTGTIYYVKHVEEALTRTYDAICLRSTAATVTMAMYGRHSTTGAPDTLLWTGVASTATGNHAITFAAGTWAAAGAAYKDGSNRLVLPYGLDVWFGFQVTASATWRALTTSLCRNIGWHTDLSTGTPSGFTGYTETAVYPTYAATATPVAYQSTIPQVALRVV